MGKLNFCKPCGSMRVRDAKDQMEKLLTKKKVVANSCGFCNKPISAKTKSVPPAQPIQVKEEPGVKRSSRLASKRKRDYSAIVSGIKNDDDDDVVDVAPKVIKVEFIDVDITEGVLKDAPSNHNNDGVDSDGVDDSDDDDDSNDDDLDYTPEDTEHDDIEEQKKGEVKGEATEEVDDKTGIKKKRSGRFIEKTLLGPDVLELIGNQEDNSGIVSCIFCHKEYDNVGKFLNHVTSHTKNERIKDAYMCGFCDQRFNRVERIKSHLRGQHHVNVNNKPTVVCTLCNKSSTRKNWLERHMATTHGEKGDKQTYKCSHMYCNREFNAKRDWERHEMIHTGVRPHICETCGRGFIRGEDLRAHVRIHSGDYIYCTLCPKFKTTKERTLKRHIKDCHLQKKEDRKPIVKNHICEVCGGAYPSNAAMNRHKVIHSDLKPFQCSETNCNYRTAFKLTLKKHIESVHLKLKPFKCRHCDRCFAESKSRASHETIHTGVRAFVCEVCGRDFNRRDGLRSHVKLHTAEYSHECDLCGYRAIRKQTLNRHMEVKHSGNASDKFECVKCNMKFVTAHSLQIHNRLHKAGVEIVTKKKFHCDQCDFSSDILRNVVKHTKRLHSDDPMYECGHCKKKFRTRVKCEDHMKKFHLKYFSPGSYIQQEELRKETGIQQDPNPEVTSAVEMIRNAAEALFPTGQSVNTVVSSTAETIIQQDSAILISAAPISTPATVAATDTEAAIGQSVNPVVSSTAETIIQQDSAILISTVPVSTPATVAVKDEEAAIGQSVNPVVSSTAETIIQQDTATIISAASVSMPATVATTDEEAAIGQSVNPVVSSTAETIIQQDTATLISATPVYTPVTVATTDEEAAILALGLLPEGIHIANVLNEVTVPATNGN